MIKVSITKNNVQTHQGQFDTQGEADAWITQGVQANWWGLPERPEAIVNSEGIEEPTGVILPAEYQVEITDITAQIEAEALKAKSILAIELGAKILAEIRHINVLKNMDAATFQALMADNLLAAIERHIWNGSFLTSKAMIISYSGSHYTQTDKEYIVNLLDDAIAKTI